MGAGGKKSFPQYLRYLSLTDVAEKMTVREKEVLKSKALAYAARVIAADRKRVKGK